MAEKPMLEQVTPGVEKNPTKPIIQSPSVRPAQAPSGAEEAQVSQPAQKATQAMPAETSPTLPQSTESPQVGTTPTSPPADVNEALTEQPPTVAAADQMTEQIKQAQE